MVSTKNSGGRHGRLQASDTPSHSAELKARVLAECSHQGMSVAQVAMAHGLNANLVHKWRRAVEASNARGAAAIARDKDSGGGFMALTLPPQPAPVALAGRCQLASPRDDNYPVRLEAGDFVDVQGFGLCVPWAPFQRLFGKRSASGRGHRPGSGGQATHPGRGCPQACPVGRWLVHGGRDSA